MKKIQAVTRLYSPALWLGLMILLCQLIAVGSGTAVAAPPIPPDQPAALPDLSTPIAITTAANTPDGATLAIVRGAPDGKTVTVVYNWRRSDQDVGNLHYSDPYYSRSTNNGATWSAPAPIYASARHSRQVDMDYAANGITHVVWQENKGLFYVKESAANSSSWSTPSTTLVAQGGDPGVTNPVIIASGANRLDIVWSEGSGAIPDPSIYHARSNNSGATWPIKAVVHNTGWLSQFPAMVVDNQTGTIHLVWQENDTFFHPNQGTIKYTRGVESGGSITWSAPVDISDVADGREPAITIIGNTLHVAYTDFRSEGTQYIRHTQCASGCTNVSNWISTANNPISGQKVGANGVDPLNAVSALVGYRQCAVVYFHGTDSGLATNEIMWGINSCDGWSQAAREKLTEDNVRTINPSLDTHNDWWLYLTYEQGTGDTRQIYLHRGKPDVYLPVILK